MDKFFSAIIVSFWFILLLSACHDERGSEPSFVDPTATIINGNNLNIGKLVYVAPFATLRAGSNEQFSINIGNESNIQDSVEVDATKGKIVIGDQAIIAHGATIRGPSTLGKSGTCPNRRNSCPLFVGFNAEVDGAFIEKDAMVLTLARVAPGVTIPSGRKVLPGKNITSNTEVEAKTAEVTKADRGFMEGVIEINLTFARGYAILADENPDNVRGINFDTGINFDQVRDLPILAGIPTRDPQFRNRIIGGLIMGDPEDALNDVMGSNISLRSDEGKGWSIGTISSMAERVVFHALEETRIELGNEGHYGFHSVVHGGKTPFKENTTITGDNVSLGDFAVIFRSRIGNNSMIGKKSLVQECDLPAGTVVPPNTIAICDPLFSSSFVPSNVEW